MIATLRFQSYWYIAFHFLAIALGCSQPSPSITWEKSGNGRARLLVSNAPRNMKSLYTRIPSGARFDEPGVWLVYLCAEWNIAELEYLATVSDCARLVEDKAQVAIQPYYHRDEVEHLFYDYKLTVTTGPYWILVVDGEVVRMRAGFIACSEVVQLVKGRQER